MYHIYQTDGIVLSGSNFGEASRHLSIFTEELGLIRAYAQGIRELKSKLRYSLQDFSRTVVCVVRGKNGWRVVNAQKKDNYALHLTDPHTAPKVKIVAKISALLMRLLAGEEKNASLFDEIITAFEFLQYGNFDSEQLLDIEVVVVMRTLNHLGYWGDNAKLNPLLRGNISGNNFLEEIRKTRSIAIQEINKSLQETQL